MFLFRNLYFAYKSCLKGKSNSLSALEFEKNLEKNLLMMSKELCGKTYIPGPFSCFPITDPKLREVWAADFKDRIIHHLLVSYIEPKWEKIFIYDSYACRFGKGNHAGVRRLEVFLRKETSFPENANLTSTALAQIVPGNLFNIFYSFIMF